MKKLLTLFVVAVIGSAIIGCSKSEDAAATPAATDATTPAKTDAAAPAKTDAMAKPAAPATTAGATK